MCTWPMLKVEGCSNIGVTLRAVCRAFIYSQLVVGGPIVRSGWVPTTATGCAVVGDATGWVFSVGRRSPGLLSLLER